MTFQITLFHIIFTCTGEITIYNSNFFFETLILPIAFLGTSFLQIRYQAISDGW